MERDNKGKELRAMRTSRKTLAGLLWVAAVALPFAERPGYCGEAVKPEFSSEDKQQIKEKIEKTGVNLNKLDTDLHLGNAGVLRIDSEDHWTANTLNPPQAEEVIKWRNVRSPVTGCMLKLPLPGHEDSAGGIDSDFCIHSLGKAAVHSRVWMCLESGYANRISYFTRPVPEKLAERIRKKYGPKTQKALRELIRVRGKTRDITEKIDEYLKTMPLTEVPDWLKYDNAVAIQDEFSAEPGFPALNYMERWQLLLEASYAYRRGLCAPVTDVAIVNNKEMGVAIRQVSNEFFENKDSDTALRLLETFYMRYMNPLPGDRQKKNSPINKMSNAFAYVFFIRLMGIYDRAGRPAKVREALVNARKAIPRGLAPNEALKIFYAALDAEVDRRLRLFEKEQEAMRFAAMMMIEPVKAGKLENPSELPAVCYMIAEHLRRTGNGKGANKWYAAAGATALPEGPIKRMLAAHSFGEELSEREKKFVTEIKRIKFTGLIKPVDMAGLTNFDFEAETESGGKTAVEDGGAGKPAREISLEQAVEKLYAALVAYYNENGKIPASLDILLKSRHITKAELPGCKVEGEKFTHSSSGASFMFDKTVQPGNSESFFLIPNPDSRVFKVVNGAGKMEK